MTPLAECPGVELWIHFANVALDFGRLWLTVTPLLQLSSLAVQPDFSLQTQLGYPF